MERKTSYTIFVSLLFILLLNGCVSRHIMGTPINESKINEIQIGKTTRAQIFEMFGSPFKTAGQSDGQLLTYIYAESRDLMTGVYNEREDKADILNIILNSEGIVTDYSFSKGVPIPDYLDPDPLAPMP